MAGPPDPPSGKDQKKRLAEEQAKRKRKPAHLRLAAALRELNLNEMADAAQTGYYDDFKSPLAMPITQLVSDLYKIGTDDAMALRLRAMNGEFDGDLADSEAWAAGPEGQAALAELMGQKKGKKDVD